MTDVSPAAGSTDAEQRPDASQAPGPPRVRRGELTSAVCALLLLGLMFATAWYGVDQSPSEGIAGAGRATAVNAWDGLTLVRWVMLITIFVVVGSVVLHVSQSAHGAQTATGAVVTVLGLLSSGLLVYRVLIALPDPNRVADQKVGAMLGLLAAFGIALGGYDAMLEERASAGRFPRRSRERVASDRDSR